MSIPVLLAITGAPWEAEVVRRTEQATNVRVVRRCVDMADVLVAAASGQARVVLLAEDLSRLNADAVAALHSRRLAVLALTDPDEPSGEDRLARIGIERILPADLDAQQLARAIADAVESGPSAATSQFTGGFVPARSAGEAGEAVESGAPQPAAGEGPGTGRLVAVWGPTGAPGRTTVAIGLAAELASAGVSTLLADADVYGGTVAQSLGMLDEASGLAAAARSAATGCLDAPALARHARQLSPHLLVLTGLSRADRWTELRPAAVESVWAAARSLAPCTVVDTAFAIESDEELSFDTMAPRRNGATLATLEEADEVVVVGSADPVGLTRLIRAIHELRAAVATATIRVVVNRARSGPLGSSPADAIAEALSRYAGVRPAAVLPFDLAACDTAMAHGSSLTEVARSSRLRKAVQQLAAEVATDLSAGAAAR